MNSYEKGRKAEEEVVRLLKLFGLPARRVPLSGAADGRLDVEVPGRLRTWRFSVKFGTAAPAGLYREGLMLLRSGEREFFVAPLKAVLAAAAFPSPFLSIYPCPKSVAQELSRADGLLARAKGKEWRLVLPLSRVVDLQEEVEACLIERSSSSSPRGA